MFASPSNQEVPPTVAASAPGQSVPPSGPYGTPSTNYGEGAPPPPPVNSYSGPPSGPYGAPSSSPYGAPQQGQYGAPPQGQYGTPGTFVPQPQFVPVQQPKKNNGCMIAVIIVLVLVVLIGGGIFAAVAVVANRAGNAIATAGADLQTAIPSITTELTPGETPSTTVDGNVPSTSQIDSAAAKQILSYQLASGVNDDLEPLDNKTSFKSGDNIYLTFTTAGHDGYILAKWYLDGAHGFDNDVLADDDGNTVGYVAGYFNLTGTVVVGLYWCTKADCSDAALAQVATATVV